MNSLQLGYASQSRMMKVLLMALVLAMVLANGSALICYNCASATGGRCEITQETCGYNKDTCVAARFTIRPYSYFRRCISRSDCRSLQSSSSIRVKCCQTDLCNTPVI